MERIDVKGNVAWIAGSTIHPEIKYKKSSLEGHDTRSQYSFSHTNTCITYKSNCQFVPGMRLRAFEVVRAWADSESSPGVLGRSVMVYPADWEDHTLCQYRGIRSNGVSLVLGIA
eukprot:2604387-Rhodomonas_salina.3